MPTRSPAWWRRSSPAPKVPKLVDHKQRRAELAEAVWTVIRRNGLARVSVRNVARAAGLSMGSLRHCFTIQSELLCFAMQLVGDRARARIAALELPADARRAAEQLLQDLVPLDGERRAEAEVWLAFTGRAQDRRPCCSRRRHHRMRLLAGTA